MLKRGGAGGRGSADRGFPPTANGTPSTTEDHPFHSQGPRWAIYVFAMFAVVLLALLLAFAIVALVTSINDHNRRHFYGANLDPLAGQLRCAGGW